MAKLLFLKHLYNLSDVRVIEEATFNLAWLWFLGLNPEDRLPEASLLTKFRTQRLKDLSLDNIITEIVRQCVEQGIIKEKAGISIDATHMEANTRKLVPERIMKHLAKRIFKALKEDRGQIPPEVDTDIPDWTKIDDKKQAKLEMKQYLEQVMEQAAPYAGEQTLLAIVDAKDVLSDERFLLQKGLRSLVDTDARVGHKSRTERFFGYKDEFMMTTDERIITAVHVQTGEGVDGKEFDSLLERTKQAGLKPTEIYGDKAYFRKGILETIKENKAEAYIPISASAYRIDEERFSYNKDSDQWFCKYGNCTEKKVTKKRTGKPDTLAYMFGKEQCLSCPEREQCLGKSQGNGRLLHVALHTAEFYDISQKQKTDEFKKKYKKRAAHEWKNGEMKQFHGLARAKGYGLRAVTTQAKLTAIAVNLKRIAALVQEQAAALSLSCLSSFHIVPIHRFRLALSAQMAAAA